MSTQLVDSLHPVRTVRSLHHFGATVAEASVVRRSAVKRTDCIDAEVNCAAGRNIFGNHRCGHAIASTRRTNAELTRRACKRTPCTVVERETRCVKCADRYRDQRSSQPRSMSRRFGARAANRGDRIPTSFARLVCNDRARPAARDTSVTMLRRNARCDGSIQRGRQPLRGHTSTRRRLHASTD